MYRTLNADVAALCRQVSDAHTRDYRLCGQRLRLRCDDAAYAQRFEAAFRHFRCDDALSSEGAREITFLTSAGGLPAAVDPCRQRMFVFAHKDVPPTYLFYRLAFGEEAMFPLAEHLVLHGAVLEHHGAVTAIVGRTHSGKTTLGLRLALEPGYAFLSDEFCPIRLGDGIVEPFPRCLGLRPHTRKILVQCGALSADTESASQLDVDPADIRGLCIGRGGPLRNIVILSGEGVSPARGDQRMLDLSFVNAEVLADLRAVGGVRGVAVIDRPAGFGTTVAIDVEPGARVAERLIHVCRVQHGMESVSFLPPDACRPDFGGVPALSTVAPVRGLLEVVRYLANHPALHDRIGPGYPKLLHCLAGRLRAARFFSLRPGPLEETCRLLRREVFAT